MAGKWVGRIDSGSMAVVVVVEGGLAALEIWIGSRS